LPHCFSASLYPAFAQIGPELQMAALSKKLQLTDTQKKQLAPIVEQRDREAKALKADTSMGKLQKLRQGRHQTKTLLPRLTLSRSL